MNNSLTKHSPLVLKQLQSLISNRLRLKIQNEVYGRAPQSSCSPKATQNPPNQVIQNIFDRRAKTMQRERAALMDTPENYDYLKEEVGYRLADRIFDIKRKFSKVIDMGCGRGFVSKHIVNEWVEELIMTDHSESLMKHSVCEDSVVKVKKVICDEENLTDVFEPDSIDLVISNLVLHWVNQLPTCFEQVMKILKIDGVFLASMFGIETLYELRSSLQLAEMERKGGVFPHISPFAKPVDIGGLMSRAGFIMQTIDVDEITVKYPNMFELLEDLRGMGETNAALNRCLHLSRDTLIAASAIYQQLYGGNNDKSKEGEKGNEKGEKGEEKGGGEESGNEIPATFQIIYLIGWKPDPSRPLPPQKDPTMVSLRDFYKIDEVGIGKPIKFKIEEEDK